MWRQYLLGENIISANGSISRQLAIRGLNQLQLKAWLKIVFSVMSGVIREATGSQRISENIWLIS